MQCEGRTPPPHPPPPPLTPPLSVTVQINLSVWDHDKFSGDDYVSALRISLADLAKDPRLTVRAG